MAKSNVSKFSVEEEVKTLKKHFGGIIATVKALKETVDALGGKVAPKKIKEVLEMQKAVKDVINSNENLEIRVKILENQNANQDEARGGSKPQKDAEHCIVRNAEAVKRLDKEIETIVKDKSKKDDDKKRVDEAIKRLDEEMVKLRRDKKCDSSEKPLDTNEKRKKERKCKYFNCGYCKYKDKCKFSHANKVCEKYLEGKCDGSECPDRHPKKCKWFVGKNGCRRNENCDFWHGTLAQEDQIINHIQEIEKEENYDCVSCKHTWKEHQFVVKHMVNNTEVYFCLNCDDWVRDKSKVLDPGWSLFDLDGNLNHFV